VGDVIAFRNDGVFVPLGDVNGYGIAFRDEPFSGIRIHYHALAILDNNASTALVIDHCVVGRIGVGIALVATNNPLPDLGHFLGPVLNARVVLPRDLEFYLQFEVLQSALSPDEELVVIQMVRAVGLPNNFTIFDGPEFWIPIPSGEIFTVEQ